MATPFLLQMATRPYAIGERPGGYVLPMLGMSHGEDAWKNLSGALNHQPDMRAKTAGAFDTLMRGIYRAGPAAAKAVKTNPRIARPPSSAEGKSFLDAFATKHPYQKPAGGGPQPYKYDGGEAVRQTAKIPFGRRAADFATGAARNSAGPLAAVGAATIPIAGLASAIRSDATPFTADPSVGAATYNVPDTKTLNIPPGLEQFDAAVRAGEQGGVPASQFNLPTMDELKGYGKQYALPALGVAAGGGLLYALYQKLRGESEQEKRRRWESAPKLAAHDQFSMGFLQACVEAGLSPDETAVKIAQASQLDPHVAMALKTAAGVLGPMTGTKTLTAPLIPAGLNAPGGAASGNALDPLHGGATPQPDPSLVPKIPPGPPLPSTAPIPTTPRAATSAPAPAAAAPDLAGAATGFPSAAPAPGGGGTGAFQYGF